MCVYYSVVYMCVKRVLRALQAHSPMHVPTLDSMTCTGGAHRILTQMRQPCHVHAMRRYGHHSNKLGMVRTMRGAPAAPHSIFMPARKPSKKPDTLGTPSLSIANPRFAAPCSISLKQEKPHGSTGSIDT